MILGYTLMRYPCGLIGTAVAQKGPHLSTLTPYKCIQAALLGWHFL